MLSPRSIGTAEDARTAWTAHDGHTVLIGPPADSPSTTEATGATDKTAAEGAATYLTYMATIRDGWAADHDDMVAHLQARPDDYGASTPELIMRFARQAREARAGARGRRDLAARIRAEGMPPGPA